MVGFWKWFDRASRVDFVGTLLGFVFDPKAWAFGGVGGVVSAIAAYISDWSPAAVFLSLVGGAAAVAIVYIGFCLFWDRLDGQPSRDAVSSAGLDQDKHAIPLWEAARRAFEACRGTRGGDIAKAISPTPADLISYYAHALIEKLPIFGTAELMHEPERVPFVLGSSAIRLEFDNKIAYAKSAFQGEQNYKELFVLENDLVTQLKS